MAEQPHKGDPLDVPPGRLTMAADALMEAVRTKDARPLDAFSATERIEGGMLLHRLGYTLPASRLKGGTDR